MTSTQSFDAAMRAFAPALPLAVGLSGGADSTALLLACARRWPGQVQAIHVHHGLQAAADGFEQHCTALCRSLDVPLTVRRLDARHAPGRSPEDAARQARYKAFESVALASQAPAAPEVVAIPVREVPEPGARLQPLPASAPMPASARYTPTEEGDVWHATVQQLVAAEAITALVRELALQSQLVARDGGHWLLRVERESLNQPTARERLRAALEAAGHASQISVEVGMVIDSPARRNAAAAAERQRRAEEIVANDPYVQGLMRDYGARIVPGSIKPA